MTFYNPAAFIFALTLPAILILYLLKQKREDYEISSILLWQAVIRDIEASAPWQKLRKNLLMILQLLAMALLILALSQPFLERAGGRAEHVIVIIDTSMSMQATDTRPSRFEAAKREAVRYVSNLKPGTRITLINMGTSVVIEENMNAEKNRVLEKLRRMKAGNGSENRVEAAELVKGMLEQQHAVEVVCFSDRPLEIEGIQTRFFSVAGNGENYAVADLSHLRHENGITVLSRITNYGSEDADIPVSLYVNGKMYDAKKIRVRKGETANVYWDRVPLEAEVLECRLDLQDALEADNTAWDAVKPDETRKILLVSRENIFIEKAISVAGNTQLLKSAEPSDAQLAGYDLYIFDGMLPGKLPGDGSVLVFNPPEGNGLFKVTGTDTAPKLSAAKTGSGENGHDILKYVDIESFSAARTRILEVPPWADAVINCENGAVAFAGIHENRRIAVFGFDIHDTDLPLTVAFPVMMANLLDWLVPADVWEAGNIYPGTPVKLNLNPKTTRATVITPGGSAHVIAPPFPPRIFNETAETGKYTLRQESADGAVERFFTVNPPVALESDISETVETGGKNDGNISAYGARTGLDLQGMLLWAVMLLLCLEWWVYTHDV